MRLKLFSPGPRSSASARRGERPSPSPLYSGERAGVRGGFRDYNERLEGEHASQESPHPPLSPEYREEGTNATAPTPQSGTEFPTTIQRTGDGSLRHLIDETVSELTNTFPPRRTPVPQPDDPTARVGRIMGFFTDTTLCIGCKACEVACKQWNQLPSDGLKFTGNSYDNTGHLSATTWRHVAFKEKITDDGQGTGRWLMLSDVCKHCESAPCQHSCPTGAIIYNQFGDVYVQNDICNGCGYCVTACPFGVLGRADKVEGDLPGDGRAHKCTLCMDRQAEDMTPACAKSCPTSSIQFGPVEFLREKARQRVSELHERGNDRAYLYGCDSVGDYGPLNSFFLLEDHPNEYNLPVAPPQPFRGQGRRYAASVAVGVALTALSFFAFRGGRRRG